MISRRRLIAALVPGLLAGVLGLAGCSSSSGSTNSPAPSGASASAEENSPAPSDVPASAEAYSASGAKAFAKAWVHALNKATTSGDTTTLLAMSAPSCAVCTDFAHSLDKMYSAGGHVETQGWKLASVVPIAGEKKLQHPAFQVVVTAAPQKVYATKSAPAKSYAGGHQGMRMFLKRAGDHWLVQKIEIAQGS